MATDPLLTYQQAAEFLCEELGQRVTVKQLQNARERKAGWPFFKDPLSGRVVIRKSALLAAWRDAEFKAVHGERVA